MTTPVPRRGTGRQISCPAGLRQICPFRTRRRRPVSDPRACTETRHGGSDQFVNPLMPKEPRLWHLRCTRARRKEVRAMTLLSFLLLLLVAGICGSIGQAIAGYSRGGCLTSIALGFIGALLGMWIAGRLGLPELFA